jgi:hypothetical protein
VGLVASFEGGALEVTKWREAQRDQPDGGRVYGGGLVGKRGGREKFGAEKGGKCRIVGGWACGVRATGYWAVG